MRQLGRRTTRQANDALVEFLQKLLVDARLIVEALQVGLRSQFDQIPEAGPMHRQQRQMKAGFSHRGGSSIATVPWSDIRFITQNRFYVALFTGSVKIERSVKVAVVGDRNRVHAVAFDFGNQVGNAVGSVQQAVMRVAMEMNEGRRVTHSGSLHLLIVVPSVQSDTIRCASQETQTVLLCTAALFELPLGWRILAE